MEKQDLAKLNKEELLKEAETQADHIAALEERVELLQKQLNASAQIAQNSIDSTSDLLNQLNGALKSGSKLHNFNTRNFQQIAQSIDNSKKK